MAELEEPSAPAEAPAPSAAAWKPPPPRTPPSPLHAIRDSLADLLGAYRDLALLAVVPPGHGLGPEVGAEGTGDRAGQGFGRDPGSRGRTECREAPLVHPDKAGTLTRLAARIDPATALRAAGAIEEADRRLAIGAAPLLTLEAAFLSVQAALRGPAIPMQPPPPSAAEHQFAPSMA